MLLNSLVIFVPRVLDGVPTSTKGMFLALFSTKTTFKFSWRKRWLKFLIYLILSYLNWYFMCYTPSNILIVYVSSGKKLKEKGWGTDLNLKIFFEFCYDFKHARKKNRLRVVPLFLWPLELVLPPFFVYSENMTDRLHTHIFNGTRNCRIHIYPQSRFNLLRCVDANSDIVWLKWRQNKQS